MSDDPVLSAVQKFIDAVETRMSAREAEIRSLLDELQTRATPAVVEGPPGKDGKDARGIERMWVDTVGELCVKYTNGDQEILGPVVGRNGGDGKPGERGTDGINGQDGKVGENGKDGTPGERGEKGDTGERGSDGLQGREGTPGSPGKDGAPGEKGERGADGIATREELESLMEARFAEIQVRTFADAYRGVFKQGELYKRGEFVTWDGSLHLALSDTKAKPATDAAWQLVTKRGRDNSR